MIVEDVVGYLPHTAGRIVGICQLRDSVLIACEYRVYRLREDWRTDGVVLEAIAAPMPMPSPI